ncbi:hypothetical protein GGX14DRAFT_391696 [Mycena pura]|uniref:Uncharacterized protein n=1 Tax=Mycena pura TaxID=153505 RepID=A0AAD6VPZ7_9AGAR|nr:hypothetical protein GGX14DRAFT_391696 [Mycena pura]
MGIAPFLSISDAVEILDATADFTSTDVEEYRRVMFPSALQNPASALLFNLFTVEDAPLWMTARGYTLYQEYSQSIMELQERSTASTASDRSEMVGACYIKHHFFALDQAGPLPALSIHGCDLGSGIAAADVGNGTRPLA